MSKTPHEFDSAFLELALKGKTLIVARVISHLYFFHTIQSKSFSIVYKIEVIRIMDDDV